MCMMTKLKICKIVFDEREDDLINVFLNIFYCSSLEDEYNEASGRNAGSWKRRLFLKVRHRGFHTAPHAAVGHLVESRRFARLHPSATAQCLSEAFVGPPV